jgi:outer membrane protein OmpA-like peptidoglycan-associated protein
MKKSSIILLLCGVTVGPFYLGGCAGTSSQTKGTAIGAGAGGAIGAIIGNRSDHRDRGAIIGAVVGGVLGNVIGKRLDEQARELEQVPGVEDVTYDKQSQKINTEMKIHFDVDKAVIKPSETVKLDELAAVFAKYPENIVVLEGHTDSDGSDTYNKELSERRARAIEAYLRQKSLDIASLSSVGYGESMPIAPNDSRENKEKNRRVEIRITVDPNRVPQDQTY